MIRYGDQYRAVLERFIGDGVDPESVCIARLDETGCPVAVFGFAGWDGDSIEGMLWAEPGGLSRELLAACAWYVYAQLDCARLTIRVRDDNHAMLELAPRLGFVLEGTMRAAHQGRDVKVFGMLRTECRWLRLRAHREETQGTAAA